MFVKKLVLILISILVTSSCAKVEEKLDIKAITKIIDKYNKNGYFSGVAIITKGDKILYKLVNGFKNENKDPIHIESQFFIASLSKQFTAAATLKSLYDKFGQLYDKEEKITQEVINSLKNPISVYLDENHEVWNGDMPKWAHQVTLHQLLSNTSGILSYTEIDKFNEVKNGLSFYQQPHSASSVIDLIKNQDLLFEPGTYYDYSNTNYFLLALVIENISGTTYHKYLEEKIFHYLEMNRTNDAIDGNLAKIRNRPDYSELVDQFHYNPFDPLAPAIKDKIYTNASVIKGTHSIISTAGDLVKWNQALHKNFLVLPKSLHDLMIKNYAKKFNDNFYGYGIIPTSTNIGPIFTHTGGLDGFQSILRYYNDDDISLIILNNIGPDLSLYLSKVHDIENNLKSKVANPLTRRIIAETKAKVQYPDKRNFINLLEDIDQATIIDTN